MQYETNTPVSTFFPMSDLPIMPPAGEKIPACPAAASGGRLVLIFTKDADSGLLYRTLLKLWGFRAEECDSFEELSVLLAGERPALILMDGVLQFEEGLDDIRRLRRQAVSREIPVVLISGFAQPRFRSRALAQGADDYLVKPLDFELLKNCLTGYTR